MSSIKETRPMIFFPLCAPVSINAITLSFVKVSIALSVFCVSDSATIGLLSSVITSSGDITLSDALLSLAVSSAVTISLSGSTASAFTS